VILWLPDDYFFLKIFVVYFEKTKMVNKKVKGVNWRVVGYSLIALGFVGLGIFVDWVWFLGAVIIIWLNQRELMGK
jgi:hypothetical protein